MSLKKLTDFIRDDIEPNREGKRPDARTVKKLPFVVNFGDTWWVDMDQYRESIRGLRRGANRLNELLQDERVADLVRNG